VKEVRVVPIDFFGTGGYLQPADPELFKMVNQFCKERFAKPIDLTKLAKSWACVEYDEDGTPVAVLGVTGYVLRPDVAVFRSLNKMATWKLYERMNNFFADNAMRDQEVFVFVSEHEGPELRCPAYEDVLDTMGAKSAERHVIQVR
jgi:hypothetical protein